MRNIHETRATYANLIRRGDALGVPRPCRPALVLRKGELHVLRRTNPFEELKAKNADQPEFIQAATEILSTLGPALDAHPEYEENALLERFVEPERVNVFRVQQVDDSGKVQVNRGYRVEFNSAIGPYKGGLASTPRLRSAC